VYDSGSFMVPEGLLPWSKEDVIGP